MKRYVVLEPAGADAPTEDAVFVRDGFSLVAFLLPVVWLLRYQLFAAALLLFMLMAVCGLLARFQEIEGLVPVATLLLGTVVALEGPSWRISGLLRRGHRQAAIIYADSSDEAELSYFASEMAADRAKVASDFDISLRERNPVSPQSLLDVPRRGVV